MHTALSLTLSGTEVLKMTTEELPELRTGEGLFHFTFFIYIYMVILFLLETSIIIFRFVCLFLDSV